MRSAGRPARPTEANGEYRHVLGNMRLSVQFADAGRARHGRHRTSPALHVTRKTRSRRSRCRPVHHDATGVRGWRPRASGGRPAALHVTDDTARHLRYTSRAKREADVSLSHRCTMEHPVAPWCTTMRRVLPPRDKRVKASPHRHKWMLSHGAPADPSDPWNSHAAPVSPRQNGQTFDDYLILLALVMMAPTSDHVRGCAAATASMTARGSLISRAN